MTISTIDAARACWTLLKTEKQVGPLIPGHGIDDYWLAHPELGSPITPEQDWSDVPGGRIRGFSAGRVGWDATNGAREITT
jgi:hypothetical protein